MARPAIRGADVVVYRDAAKHSMVAQKSLNGKGDSSKSFAAKDIDGCPKNRRAYLNASGPKI
jgi:hypothetical protein